MRFILGCGLYICFFAVVNCESVDFPAVNVVPNGQIIPRIVHSASKNCANELPARTTMKELNPTWTFKCYENDHIDEFMMTYFANTSTLWAYNLIEDDFWIMKSDMFRYCVLYVMGGLYIDDDAVFVRPLDEVIQTSNSSNPSPSAIVSREKARARGILVNFLPGYIDQYVNTSDVYFDNGLVVNWAMFFASGHPFLKAILEECVNMIRLEYMHSSPFIQSKLVGFSRNTVVFCSTGPCLVTIALRKLLINNKHISYDYTFLPGEFWNAGGRHGRDLGMRKYRTDPTYYSKVIASRRSHQFLKAYGADSDKWNGTEVIQSGPRDTCQYFQVSYGNVSLQQCIRPYADLLSNFIRKHKCWAECSSLPEFWHELGQSKRATEQDIFVDVGANIGSCTILMLAHKIPTVAFEPMVANLFYMTSSVKMLPPDSQQLVTIYKMGVGSAPSVNKLYSDPGNAGHSIVGNLVVEPWRHSVVAEMRNNAASITIKTLDDVLWPHKVGPPPSIRLMKIDVEGYEKEAILGARNLLDAKAIAMIKFEMATNWLHAQNSSAADIFLTITNSGYAVKCAMKNGKYVSMDLEMMTAFDIKYPGKRFFQTECIAEPIYIESM